jgi:CSLREA domain-containing protein
MRRAIERMKMHTAPVKVITLWLFILALLVVPGRADLFADSLANMDRSRVAAARETYVNLRDGRKLQSNYQGAPALAAKLLANQAQPLSLATADMDEDGVPDLICGYADGQRDGQSAGIVTTQRGDVNAVWPSHKEAGNSEPAAAFLPDVRVLALPVAPDFLAAGDFDGDGHQDVIAARRGDSAFYFLRGDGHGGLGEPVRTDLPGSITALTTGEINRADGLPDIVVGVNGTAGPKVLVFESPAGALRAVPEVFPLPMAATSLVLGRFGGDQISLAIAAGNNLLLVRGRDRKLSLDESQQQQIAAPVITTRALPFLINAIAVGNFSGAFDAELALRSEAGGLYLLTPPQAAATSEQAGVAPVAAVANNSAVGAVSARPSSESAGLQQFVPQAERPLGDWSLIQVSGADSTGASLSQASGVLLGARLSDSGHEQLLSGDRLSHQINVGATGIDKQENAASLSLPDEPVAVLPMRLDASALRGLVVLSKNSSSPLVLMAQAVMTFTVNTADDHDDGKCDATDCSLREAINAANANAGADMIAFSIPGAGVHTIKVKSNLPELTDAVTIDGYTQPGASANTLTNGDNAVIQIELSGSMAPAGTSGLVIGTSGCTIRGLAINSFTFMFDGSADVDGFGIALAPQSGANNNSIEGNFIGVDATGTVALPNTNGGIFVDHSSNNNTFGGTAPAARNLISGNGNTGLTIFLSLGNTIQGNFIGTDITGTQSFAHSQAGVYLHRAQNTTIGGTAAGARNIISGNDIGVSFHVADNSLNGLAGTLIQGNFIGPDVHGSPFLGNYTGMDYFNAFATTVGGTTPAAANVISGNFGSGSGIGILFGGSGSEGNLVQGNFIGTDASGANLGNTGDGIRIQNATSNSVGGTATGAANVIAFNGGNGVTVLGTGEFGFNGSRNSIRGNSIHDIVFLGIDLGNDGVTANNSCNANTAGPNQLQNYPVLTDDPSGTVFVTATATDANGNTSEFSKDARVQVSGGNLTIQGSLDSKAGATFTIDFYANAAFSATGSGQGQTYLGSTTVTTAASCGATINSVVPAPTPPPTAPPNDNFANAQVVSGCSGSVTGTNIAATKEAGEPNNPDSPTSTRSVWYQWQAPSTGSATIDTHGSDFDTVLAVYTGSSVSGLTLVTNGSNDDASASDPTSTVTISVTQGTIYRIAVNGFNHGGKGGDTGNIKLNWTEANCTAPPTPTPTPTPTPGKLLNIATRLRVLNGDNVLIGGFIITGTDPKRVIIRGIGPSLNGVGVTLSDPILELHQGATVITNDNWKINDQTGQSQEADIRATTIPPTNDLESAIIATLAPGNYTAILAGKNGGTGVGIVEVYDLAQGANSTLANISSRGFVDTGDNVMIGGLIVGGGSGGGSTRVIVRAIGPSLSANGNPLPGRLADPTLELHNASGTMIVTNDNWKINDQTGQSQEADIRATTVPPTNDLESAIVATLPPDNYTAIVRGKNNTVGIAVVEAYNLQ